MARASPANGAPITMKETTKRSIVRWIHIICSIPIVGYIYSPFDQIPNYAPPTRFVFFPVMLLTGLWMWKGHLVRRLFARQMAQSSGSAAS
jgi:thiosulfate reductase cytochrome b subunit